MDQDSDLLTSIQNALYTGAAGDSARGRSPQCGAGESGQPVEVAAAGGQDPRCALRLHVLACMMCSRWLALGACCGCPRAHAPVGPLPKHRQGRAAHASMFSPALNPSLPGPIVHGRADKEELSARIQQLEERLNDRKEALLEKELILEEVTALADKLRAQVQACCLSWLSCCVFLLGFWSEWINARESARYLVGDPKFGLCADGRAPSVGRTQDLCKRVSGCLVGKSEWWCRCFPKRLREVVRMGVRVGG